MISVVIPHCVGVSGADEALRECVRSLRGEGEIIVMANERKGYAWAVNRGLELASGDRLVVANNDCSVVHGSIRSWEWLDEMQVVTPAIEPEPRDRMPRAFFCMTRHVYELVGGFDERFEGGYFEDDDMIRRMRSEGVQFVYDADVVVHHLNGGGLTMKAIGEQQHFDANRRRYEEKWTDV